VLVIAFVVGVFLTSLSLVRVFLRYAVANKLLDVPNSRSSHSVATLRGGGTAIVITTVASILLLGACHALAWRAVTAFVGAGLVVAGIGFLDDRGNTAPSWRLLGHFAAAGWMLAWLGGVPPVLVFGMVVPAGIVGQALATLFVVWLINLTNFMDGIDGIAGVETITVCAGGCILYALVASRPLAWLAPLALMAAALGFLFWNWPPAKVFMGDTGSGFLGLLLSGFALQAGWLAPRLFWGWVILMGVFVVDATVTLIRRVVRGETFYKPHRSHAYQHAAQRFGRHLPVTLAVSAINICWLLPIACLVAWGSIDVSVAVLIAYVPLVVVALLLDAGGKQPVRA
jgi:Fuc2NAc and GlcNAc transferase